MGATSGRAAKVKRRRPTQITGTCSPEAVRTRSPARSWSIAVAPDGVAIKVPFAKQVTSPPIVSKPQMTSPFAVSVDLVASDGSAIFRVRTRKLPISVNGAGDAIAALFFAHHLRTGSAAEALSRAASSIFGLLRRTRKDLGLTPR